MSRIKFGSFLLMILVLSLVFFSVNGPIVASARAGSSPSSSSSSSTGRSSSSSSSSYGSSSSYNDLDDSSDTSNGMNIFLAIILQIFFPVLGMLLFFLFFFMLFSVAEFCYQIQLYKKRARFILFSVKLSVKDSSWSYKYINREVRGAFYAIQNAWMERDQDLAKEYMSNNLYIKHKRQTDDMKEKKIINILENMNLIKIIPIGLKYKGGANNDSFWVYIKAKSIDFTINEKTKGKIKGSINKSVKFTEYWKFVRKDNRWVVDRIMQDTDVKNLDFFKIEVN